MEFTVMSNLSVYKANILMDASHKLNAQVHKLILTCLAKLNSRNIVPKEITLTGTYFSKLMKIDLRNAH